MGRGELRRRGGGLRARVCEAMMSGGNILGQSEATVSLDCCQTVEKRENAPEPYLAVYYGNAGCAQVALENAQLSAQFTPSKAIDDL